MPAIKAIQSMIIPLLLAAAFSTSLFFGGYQDITYAPALILMLLAAFFALIHIKRSAIAFPAAPPAMFLFAFWLFATISLTWSSVPFSSLITWMIFLTTPLVFLTLLTAANKENIIKHTALLAISGLSILAAYAVYQYITPGGPYEGRAHLPLPNPNSLGGLLAMAVPPLIALFLHQKDKRALIVFAATLLILAGTFATGSRGAIIALIVALIVQFFMLRKTETARPKLRALILGGILVFCALNFTGKTQITHRLAGLAQPTQEKEVIHRLALWESSIEMVKDAPLLGRGLATFYLTYPAYRDPADRSMGNWAHMDSLQFATEMGLLAPLLLYLFWGSVLLFTLRALKQTTNAPQRLAISGSFCGLLVIAIHSHATFHLYIMPILMLCALLLAIWYVFAANILNTQRFWLETALHGKRKIALNIAAFIAIISIGLVTISAAAGSYYTLKARDAIGHNDIIAFTNHIEKAQAYGPASFIDPYVQVAGFYADIAHTSVILHSPEEQQKLVSDVEYLLQAAQAYNPHWAEINYKRGAFYNQISTDIVPDAKERAEENWQTALDKNPMHYRARQQLAALYIEKGQPQKAYNLVEDGLKFPAPQNFYDKFWVMREQLKPLMQLQTDFKRQQDKTE